LSQEIQVKLHTIYKHTYCTTTRLFYANINIIHAR